MSSRELILIVGLQKSGTTLLERLLVGPGRVPPLVDGEGDAFWGNEPAFTPRTHPAGTIYQRSGGDRGHVADATDATAEIRTLMHERLDRLRADRPLVLNKNPYNSVRVPWIRAIFPRALIVATLRRAVPNVFSLRKKFMTHDEQGLGPEEGWWGLKPEGWRDLRSDDPLRQCAMMWRRVNETMLAHRDAIDLLVTYDELCVDPERVVRRVLAAAGRAEWRPNEPMPVLRSFDDEFRTGSRLRSKNRVSLDAGTLEVQADDRVEVAPLRAEEIEMIERICAPVTEAIGEGA